MISIKASKITSKIYLTKARSKWSPMKNTNAIPLTVKESSTTKNLLYIYIYI